MEKLIAIGVLVLAFLAQEGASQSLAFSEMRLVNGTTKYNGRVEVQYGGQWGGVCADYYWGTYEAKVACKQLGFYGGYAVDNIYYGPGNGTIWMSRMGCYSSSYSYNTKLWGCSKTTWSTYNSNICSGNKYAGVQCQAYSGQNPCVAAGQPCKNNGTCSGSTYYNNYNCYCKYGYTGKHCETKVPVFDAIKLVNGTSKYNGRVLVRYEGQWGSICADSYWDSTDAKVACKTLGFIGGYAVKSDYYGKGNMTALMSRLGCSYSYTYSGSTKKLWECSHTKRTSYTLCSSSQNGAGLQCAYSGYNPCTNNPCKNNGTCSGTNYYSCNCKSGYSGKHCETRVPVFDAIKLVNGTSKYNGRVLVRYGGQWGSICDSNWDSYDAKVACKTLGFTGGNAVKSDYYGQGNMTAFMSYLGCYSSYTYSSSTKKLWECSHTKRTSYTLCSGSQNGAGLQCAYSGYNPCTNNPCKNSGACSGSTYSGYYSCNCKSGYTGKHCETKVPVYDALKLVNGTSKYNGRVLVRYDGQWGSICYNSWSSYDAKVACRTLGFTGGYAVKSNYYGQGNMTALMSRVGCYYSDTYSSSTKKLWECYHTKRTSYTLCSGSENGAGLQCAYSGYNPCTNNPCKNGTCSGSTYSGYYYCNCKYSYTGKHCETKVPGYDAIKLVNGTSKYNGRVLVRYDGQWGSICADSSWGSYDAKVACKTLGFTGGNAVKSDYYGQGNMTALMSYLSCYSSYTYSSSNKKLWECSHTKRTSYTLCSGSQNGAGLQCAYSGYNPCTNNPCKNGTCSGSTYSGYYYCNCKYGYTGRHCGTKIPTFDAIKLVNGTSKYNGRVLVRYGGQWGSICDYSWGSYDAKVACRTLGFTGGHAVRSNYYGKGNMTALMSRLGCYYSDTYSSSNKKLWECSHAKRTSYNLCSSSQNGAGLQCAYSGYNPCTNNPCKNNGTCSGSMSYGYYSCNCLGGYTGPHCDTKIPWYDDIKLVNGSSPYSGRVEVSFDGKWGTICNSGFDYRDARVVCKQLGYLGGAYASSSFYGAANSSDPVWMTSVYCSSSNVGKKVWDCSHTKRTYYNRCQHSQDVGVQCLAYTGYDSCNSKPCKHGGTCTANKYDGSYKCSCKGPYSGAHCETKIPVFEDIKLVNGTNKYTGRVMVKYDGQWGTVCSDSWTTDDAKVACKQLGYIGGTAVKTNYYGPGTGNVLMSNVNCYISSYYYGYSRPTTTSYSKLWDCKFTKRSSYTLCPHSKDAGLQCIPKTGYSHCSKTNKNPCQNGGSCVVSTSNGGYTCSCTPEYAGAHCEMKSIRLVGGASSNVGRVEIYYNNEWGTVCNRTFDTADAKVACGQLGMRGGKIVSKISATSSSHKIGLGNYINCVGTEKSLLSCSHSSWGSMYRVSKRTYYRYYSYYYGYRSSYRYTYSNYCTHNHDVVLQCDKPAYTGPMTNAIKVCQKAEIDLVFIVDESGSVGKTNFDKVKTFVKKMVSAMGVSPATTHAAVVRFSDKSSVHFGLDDHDTETKVNSAVDSLIFKGGYTNTHLALDTAGGVFKNVSSRSLNNVLRIAMVLTDGKSNNNAETIASATKLKAMGVKVFGVGIGGGIDQTELKAISSRHDDTYVVSDFDTLLTSVNNITQKTCQIVQDMQLKLCTRDEIDVVFVVDESGSVGKINFQKIKTFVKKMVEEIDVSTNTSNVGVVRYSSSSSIAFELKKHDSEATVNAAVDSIVYKGGLTATDLALNSAADVFSRGRKSAIKVAVVLTDGKSNNNARTLTAAIKLKAMGVTVIAVGIGSGIDKTELKNMSTSGDNTYVASDFDKLLKSVSNITQQTCSAIKLEQTKQCKKVQADVVFVVDASGSVGAANFLKTKEFIKQMIGKADVGAAAMNIGVITYSTTAYTTFGLTKFYNKKPMVNQVSHMRYYGGGTYTHAALSKAYTMFKGSKRQNAKKVLIVMTDGKSQSSSSTLSYAKQLRDADVDIYSIGIGSGIDKTELISMSGDSDNVYYASDFNKLLASVDEISKQTCNVITDSIHVDLDINNCKQKAADVIFVMDASGSVGSSNFLKMKNAVASAVQMLDVAPKAVNIGIIRFSSSVHVHLELKNHTSTASAIRDVNSVVYNGGMTYTYLALDEAYKMFWRSSRPTAKRMVIVLTDGRSQYTTKTLSYARRLRDQAQAHIVSVGIGSSVSTSELVGIAGTNGSVLMTSDFNKLGTSMKKIIAKACKSIANSVAIKMPTYEVRLAGGQSKYDGRVEVKVNGAWGPVCDTSWLDAGANVVCGQLKYKGGKSVKGSLYGRGTLKAVLTNVQCRGTENNLYRCLHNTVTSSYCGVVSVICARTNTTCPKQNQHTNNGNQNGTTSNPTTASPTGSPGKTKKKKVPTATLR